MSVDPTKLPDRASLKLSTVIHYIAFGEDHDCDEMEQEGYPSFRHCGAAIERSLKLCRDQALADVRYSAFVELVRAPPPTATELQAFEASWPPAAERLYELITEYELEQAQEDKQITEAERTVRDALLSGRVTFTGWREPDGPREWIDPEPFARSPSPTVDWRIEMIEASTHRWGASLGEPLEWIDVKIDRPSLMEWLNEKRHSGTKRNKPNRKPGRRVKYDWKWIEGIARHVHGNLQRGGGYDSKPGATESRVIEAIQEHVKKSGQEAPSRASLQKKFIEWGLY